MRLFLVHQAMNTNVGNTNLSVREAWLERVLQTIPSGRRILDAGAGECQYRRFCAHLKYVSQDFAAYDGKGNGTGLHRGGWDQRELDIVSDITDIPEPDEAFDAVMCIEVLEHLPEPVKALREFFRLLRPGGILILSAPFCSLSHMAPFHFYGGFTRYFYEKHLAEVGFEIKHIEPNGNFFEYMAQELRRLPEVSNRYANAGLGVQGWIACRLLAQRLQRLSARDRGSAELLCYGYHVLAAKGPR